ncbi:MAG: hypothetical protein CL928_15405 [Deltaproteobacteria bacterium]|nr:hypothetical protein [Deltaproteobacteria bacterium]
MTKLSSNSCPVAFAALLAVLACSMTTGCLDRPALEADQYSFLDQDGGSGIDGFALGDDDDSAGDDDDSAGDDDDSAGDDGDSADERGSGVPFVDEDGDGVVAALDCADDDPERFPGNIEICDGLDNDCDPSTDEDLACAGEDEVETD